MPELPIDHHFHPASSLHPFAWAPLFLRLPFVSSQKNETRWHNPFFFLNDSFSFVESLSLSLSLTPPSAPLFVWEFLRRWRLLLETNFGRVVCTFLASGECVFTVPYKHSVNSSWNRVFAECGGLLELHYNEAFKHSVLDFLAWGSSYWWKSYRMFEKIF